MDWIDLLELEMEREVVYYTGYFIKPSIKIQYLEKLNLYEFYN